MSNESPTPSIKNLRWWIAGLLALATALSYLDRQSFPVVVGEIRKDIPLNDDQYGHLTFSFLLAYAIMYAAGGRIIDWLGTRAGYAVMIVWWSAANFLTGTVTSVTGLGLFRFLLGMGEGGGFPGSGKAVAEWFPPTERAMAFGTFNAGSSLGALIAPPLMAFIVSTLGWRWVFFFTGGIGFIWSLIWLWLYRPPATNRFISCEEREYIKSALLAQSSNRTRPTAQNPGVDPGNSSAPADGHGQSVSWFHLFRNRKILGLMTIKFLTDAAWFFFIFWLPKFLGDVRHLDIRQIGYFAWIPFAFSAFGSIGGGWLSSFLIRKGMPIDRARKIALAMSAALMPVSLLIAASPLSMTIVFYSLAMFGHQSWSANVQTLPADIFPSRIIGSVEGLLGSAGAFGGMLFNLLVGKLVGTHGYGPAFMIAGLMHPVAFVLILCIVRRIEPISRYE